MSISRKKNAVFGKMLCASGRLSASSGVAIDENGQPHRRYKKDLIRIGDWVHPANGEKFSIASDDLEHWVKTFNQMKLSGDRVPVPAAHTNDPEKNRGYLEDLWIDDDTLWGTIELVGEDAIALASRVEVSIYVPNELKNGKGQTFERPIAHVALVTDPVINGQGKFIPLAASRGGIVNVPVFRLSQGGGMETLKKLAELVGVVVKDDMSEEALYAAIEEKVKALKGDVEAGQKKTTEADKALAASREKIKTLEASKGLPTPSADTLALASENFELKLNRLVEAGKVGSAAAKLLLQKISDSGMAGISLSREVSKAAGLSAPLADTLIEVLSLNEPISHGAKTGVQALSRSVPGGEDKKDLSKIIDQQARLAGVTVK